MFSATYHKPKMLDLCCCAGAAADGYRAAGWEVWGCDIKPQRNYPGPFIQHDGLTLDPRFLDAFDAFHASPDCQGLTEMNNDKSRWRNQIPQFRAMLQKTGKPYTIENVRAARPHLINPVSLKGTMFDMHMVTSTGQRFDLSRERLFETNWGLVPPYDFGAQHPIANVFGGHLRARSKPFRTGNGTGRTRDFEGEDKPALARQLMGIAADRVMTMQEISESIPPVYTQFIGEQLLAVLALARAA